MFRFKIANFYRYYRSKEGKLTIKVKHKGRGPCLPLRLSLRDACSARINPTPGNLMARKTKSNLIGWRGTGFGESTPLPSREKHGEQAKMSFKESALKWFLRFIKFNIVGFGVFLVGTAIFVLLSALSGSGHG